MEVHIFSRLCVIKETSRPPKKIVCHFDFCQKGTFQWMKNPTEGNPQRFPAFDPCESAMDGGSNHTLNRLFGSLVLASGGRSSDPA